MWSRCSAPALLLQGRWTTESPGWGPPTPSPASGLTVQPNVVEPLAGPEEAVTVTVEVPAVVGVPVISPEELIDSPAGRPVAE